MNKCLLLWHIVNGEVAPFPNAENQIEITDFTYSAKRMGASPTITAEFMHPTCLDNEWDDSVFT